MNLPQQPVGVAEPRTDSGPILSYDVPQQVSFSLQNHIEIALDASFFLAQGVVTPDGDAA